MPGSQRGPIPAEVASPRVGEVPVEVRRSTRRRRTVSAYRSEGRIVVLVPARLSAAEEARWVARMVARLERRTAPAGDGELLARAQRLSVRWLEGRPQPVSVRWSDQQRRRWASCSLETGAIRLSRRLEPMPDWVVDYVLVHELTHLLVPDHSAAFWAWVGRYPQADRARGFLEGVDHVAPVGEPAGDDTALDGTALDGTALDGTGGAGPRRGEVSG